MGTTFERVAPVLPVRDVKAALENYRKLGFEVDAYGEPGDDDPEYGFIRRGAVELHVVRTENIDPKLNTSACYLYVDDADALFAEWSTAGVAGELRPPVDTPYELREIVYLDPDGNLLRIGSPTL
jgi:catechol 2,3-dioxygenase-like lactoylglutathione lyase family enzyme